VRACALYVAAAQATSPFQTQSQTLADGIRAEFGPMAETLCTTDPVMLGDRGKIASPSLVQPDSPALAPTIEASAAYLRGDYVAAAALLDPLASRAFSRDYSAEFLLASLYDAGLGVPRDWMRACAMYLRSADGGPLQLLARELWQAIQRRLTLEDSRECLKRARLGFHDGFQPVTFTLASGQSVLWTLEGATIAYLGRERSVKDDMFTLRGIRFLPVRYAPVDVGPRHATRRHFMDVLLWIPQGPPKWDLMWQLFEVVGDNLVEVTRERVSTALGDEPPDSVDLETLFRIEESDQGETLLIVLSGERPRTEVIPTQAERAEAKARQAALNGPVDWKATKDIRRPPSFEYLPASGCGRALASAPSTDFMEAITVQMADDLLPAIATSRIYDVAGTSTGLGIQVHVFGRPVRMP
jgi:hypothetical protein